MAALSSGLKILDTTIICCTNRIIFVFVQIVEFWLRICKYFAIFIALIFGLQFPKPKNKGSLVFAVCEIVRIPAKSPGNFLLHLGRLFYAVPINVRANVVVG